jgi:lysophospholipase L1-like esterase
MEERVLCIFGNSNTWGSRPGCWADLLKYQLIKEELPTFVYNLGISGDTTSGLLKRVEDEATARRPTHIIFAIGGNDAGRLIKTGRNYVLLPLFKKNISALLKAARKHTMRVAFLGMLDMDEAKTRPIPWQTTFEYVLEDRIAYDRALQGFCQKNKVFYIPRRGLLTPKDFYDGLHPTTRGHQKIFEKIKKPIQRFLRSV